MLISTTNRKICRGNKKNIITSHGVPMTDDNINCYNLLQTKTTTNSAKREVVYTLCTKPTSTK